MFTVPFTGGQSLVNLNRRGGQGSSGRRVAPTGYTGIPIWFSGRVIGAQPSYPR